MSDVPEQGFELPPVQEHGEPQSLTTLPSINWGMVAIFGGLVLGGYLLFKGAKVAAKISPIGRLL